MATDITRLTPNDEIKRRANAILDGNYGGPMVVVVIYMLISGVSSVVSWLIMGPLTLGYTAFFMKIARREDPDMEVLFKGINHFLESFLAYIFMSVFVALWSLLLIVPGIIAAISYSLTYFIMNDKPGISALDAITKSKIMMQGSKSKLFILYVSYLPWFILVGLTLGIAGLWVIPRVQTAVSLFYEDIKANYRDM
jgi:uncharacterized membrane protein